MSQTTDTTTTALLCGDAGYEPIEDRLRQNIRATIIDGGAQSNLADLTAAAVEAFLAHDGVRVFLAVRCPKPLPCRDGLWITSIPAAVVVFHEQRCPKAPPYQRGLWIASSIDDVVAAHKQRPLGQR